MATTKLYIFFFDVPEKLHSFYVFEGMCCGVLLDRYETFKK